MSVDGTENLAKVIDRQFGEAWAMLTEAIERFPDDQWRDAAIDYFVPARLVYHAIETVEYYCQDNLKGFVWGGRFGMDWDTADRNRLPAKQTLLDYLGDVRRKTSQWLMQLDENALLADALGISVEELQAARKAANQAAIEQAVETGLITQEQADEMQARKNLQSYLDRNSLLARALGMTVEELEAAREDGTLYDILSNITPAELQAQMQTAMESAVQQAVADGAITQAQADLIAEHIASGAGMMGRFGGRGGFGGHHGFGGFQTPLPDDANNSAFSTAFGA